MAQMKMSSEENNRKMDRMSEVNDGRMDVRCRKMDEDSNEMDVIGDEIKTEMNEAMGREMAAVREEVRECRIGVWEEMMRESEAKLMGEIGTITKEVKGLAVGQNELKEQMQKNTVEMKELRAAQKESKREMTAIKKE